MIAELGHYALVLALGIALVQSVVPIIGVRTRDAVLMGVAEPTALAQFGFIAFAFGALVACYVTSDFSVVTVFENSHSAMPLGTWDPRAPTLKQAMGSSPCPTSANIAAMARLA